MSAPPINNVTRTDGLERVRYSHDSMIDFLIANPTARQVQIAEVFGFTPTWVGKVINSDVFQARLAERKAELVDPTILRSVEEKMRALADQSLEILSEKLESSKSAELALAALQISTKAMGYGARQTPQIQNNFIVTVPPKLESAQAWQSQYGRAAGNATIIEGEVSGAGGV